MLCSLKKKKKKTYHNIYRFWSLSCFNLHLSFQNSLSLSYLLLVKVPLSSSSPISFTKFRNSNKTQIQRPFFLLNPKLPPLHPFSKWVIKKLEEMLQLFFTVAFSTVPLTLYVPPIRSLNLFVETMEFVVRESRSYRNRVYPRLQVAWSRMLDFMLCNNNIR